MRALILGLSFALLGLVSAAGQTSNRTVSTPPTSLGLDPFYKKYVVYRDLPIVSSDKTRDEALLRAYDTVAVMMAKRPEVLQRIRAKVDRPREFTVFNRVWVALSNLGNIGEARDVGVVLDSQAHADSAKVDAGYTALRVLIWTIPVMGFIGTVIGLGQAIGSFQNVLDATGGQSASAIKDRLGPVVSGLATKFDTTLVALLATVVVQLLTTWVYSLEEDFLSDVQSYCHENIVARLKLVDW